MPPAMPARSVLLYAKCEHRCHANTTGDRAAGNVQVWNEQGSVTSEAATLTVQERARPPVITAQPGCWHTADSSTCRITCCCQHPFYHEAAAASSLLRARAGTTSR
jgi:hypothetical protein